MHVSGVQLDDIFQSSLGRYYVFTLQVFLTPRRGSVKSNLSKSKICTCTYIDAMKSSKVIDYPPYN